MSTSRIADIAHKSFVSICIGVTVIGLGEALFMHRSIMQQGEEAIAAKEMDHLRQLREQGLEATKGQPFPDGTDLHSTSPSGQQSRI